jgi:hypothetical protein
MLSLTIQQIRTELHWLDRIAEEIHLRAPARRS